jgi:L-alanine-DL-glutamate epimerase-like enolase superfamily enzyme
MKKGHKAFKFKCSDEDPVRLWTDEIKKKCGDGIKIILDPNQRWNDVETTLRLMEGVDKNIMLGLEDPIQHEDVEGFKFLKQNLGIPLVQAYFIAIYTRYKRHNCICKIRCRRMDII